MSGSKVDVKVVLLGKSYAGKTCLVERYIHERFNGETVPYHNTIGAAFGAKKITLNGKSIVLGIWDTAGSERYESMSRIYYRNAKAAVLCFDLTDKSSFDRVRFWIGELQAHEENCKIYICGTKKDIVDDHSDKRDVNAREVEALANDVMADVYETSSKTGQNIRELFNKIAQDYLKNNNLQDEKEAVKLNTSVPNNPCSCKN